jgi:pyruvate/2-oxoglutarate dehydrogenase complex dihydrolipoamide acyltransferase (E2) component
MNDALAVPVPRINPNDDYAVVVRWHVDRGARVEVGETLVTLETTKTTFDVEAPRAGYVLYEHEQHQEVAVGAPVAWITASADSRELRAEPAQPIVEQSTRFTRKALKLMREHGLTAADFPGDARVDAEAVSRVAGTGASKRRPAPADVDHLELTPVKIAEVHALRRVQREAIPSAVAVALSSERLARRLSTLSAEHGPVSLLEVCIHELGQLLTQWPEMNGYYAEDGAWRYRHVGVGFAVNLGRGLRVPVVRDPGGLSLRQVAQAVRELSLRYMRDELGIDDVAGGTFTVTDLSAEGVVNFVPVLNERQSAILGITAERAGTSCRELVLTFDHRLSDGMRAARFLVELRKRLEETGE